MIFVLNAKPKINWATLKSSSFYVLNKFHLYWSVVYKAFIPEVSNI